MTQLEEMLQLDTVVAVVEIVVEVAVETAVETAVEVVIVVEDFLESQKMQVFDNKLEIFQGPGSCMAAIK